MRLLLDTHVFIWSCVAPGQLNPAARTAIVGPANRLYLSPISIWEIAIKTASGKLRFPADARHALRQLRAAELPVTIDHAIAVAALPLHHRDPFDRMLIAQALTEGLTLVTRDDALADYGVPVLLA